MFFTMTMLLVCCVKIAPLMTVTGSVRLPDVRNSSAEATGCGILSKPSRSGSSPISINNSRTSFSIFSVFRAMPGILSQSLHWIGNSTGLSPVSIHIAAGSCLENRGKVIATEKNIASSRRKKIAAHELSIALELERCGRHQFCTRAFGADKLAGALIDQDFGVGRLRAQPRCEIHRRTDGHVFEAGHRADDAHGKQTPCYCDTQAQLQ